MNVFLFCFVFLFFVFVFLILIFVTVCIIKVVVLEFLWESLSTYLGKLLNCSSVLCLQWFLFYFICRVFLVSSDQTAVANPMWLTPCCLCLVTALPRFVPRSSLYSSTNLRITRILQVVLLQYISRRLLTQG